MMMESPAFLGRPAMDLRQRFPLLSRTGGVALGAFSLVTLVRAGTDFGHACKTLDAMGAVSATRRAGLALIAFGFVPLRFESDDDVALEVSADDDVELDGSAYESCAPYIKRARMDRWAQVFGLAQCREAAMQRVFVGMEIRTQEDFRREILDKVDANLKGDAFDMEVLQQIAMRRGVDTGSSRSWLPAISFSVWALVTVAMVQRSPGCFAVGIASGVFERGIRSRGPDAFDLRQVVHVWGLPSVALRLFYPEWSQIVTGLFTVPLGWMMGFDGFQGATLLSSSLAGRSFAHTMMVTAGSLMRRPSRA